MNRSRFPFRPFLTLKVGDESMRWLLIALAAILALFIVTTVLAQTPVDNYDTDGDGLIEIDSLAQLNAVRWDLDGNGAADSASNDANYASAFPVTENGSVCPSETACTGYELTANLDFDENGDGEITEADATYWNNGGGWMPIGREGVTALNDGSTSPRDARLFHVTFDGNGHTIANLYTDRSTKNTQGLFSVLGTGAEVRNLGLPGVDVTADRYAGGLAGWSQMETSITAAWATGKVVGTYDTGGLIGETFGSATRCWAAVDVTGGFHAGGLVGENEISGAITDSYATGTVKGDNDVGGLVGYNAAEFGGERKGAIIRSYATGSVSGKENVGGLVGLNDGTIKSSYAMSTVSGNSDVGGLVGDNEFFTALGDTIEGTIQGSYAVGTVSGNSDVGGLVGNNDGTITASYYDSDVSGRLRDSGNKTTAELTAPTGYDGIYAGWNLDLDNADGDGDDSTGGDDPWRFGTTDQYPVLKADLDGDGDATWQEFGYQLRERPILAARVAGPRVFLSWNPADASHWENPPSIAYSLYRNGEKVAGYDGSSTSYTDTGLTVGQTYTYHVVTLLDGVEIRRSNRAASTPESAPNNHDADSDGLIEINSLAKLNAVRWDLDGDGTPAAGNEEDYAVAFPVAEDGAVCPAGITCAGYELTANLDFDENGDGEITDDDVTYWNEGEGWEPIGAKHVPFLGIFEGNDHTIANLFIDRMGVEALEGIFWNFTNQGLFAELGSTGEIRNLGLTKVDVAGGDYAAGLAGWSNGTISSCYVTGKVVGTYDTGGLTGENWHIISDSYADVTVNGQRHAGGLTGENEHSGKIFNSYATGAVSGRQDTGGLVGYTEPGSSIIGSYATGAVNGQSNTGGLVGHNNGATISASYATGAVVNLVGYSGGLVGWNDGTVIASYATGAVSGQDAVGGLVGRNGGSINASYATGTATVTLTGGDPGVGGLVGVNLYGTITASYHDSETSRHTDGSYAKTTAELQAPRGYTGIYSAWNVDLDGDSNPDNPWDFGTDQQYPALKTDFNGDNTASWEEFGYQSRLTATASDTQIELSWNALTIPHRPEAPITYVLYRDDEKMTGYDGSSTSYTDTDLTTGQTYTYQLATLLNGVETQRSNRATLGLAAESARARHDADGDGLIEINSLAQLDAIRYDLNGDGIADDTAKAAAYDAAFPVAESGSVCTVGDTCAGYELAANLDFDENGDGEITAADATYWNGGGGWQPIGLFDGEFATVFEGNDHTINSLFISRRRGQTYADGGVRNIAVQGLFGGLGADAVVRNLGLTRVNVSAEWYVGGLAGRNLGTIADSYVTGTVSGDYAVGGLIGDNWNVIEGSHAAVSVNGRRYIGGLAGENGYGGAISTSYATGTVRGERDAGGLVGYNGALGVITASHASGTVAGPLLIRGGGLVGHNRGTISASYAAGATSGGLAVGGLAGLNEGTIDASYAVGSVSGQNATGSLVGRNKGTINASYATGPAISTIRGHRIGGLVGQNRGTISASYLDTQTAGISLATTGNPAVDAGDAGRTTAELQSPNGYAGIYADWNSDLDGDSVADNPWDFGADGQYPALQVDFNGDGTATWQEFGYQLRQRPTLTATATGTQVELTWNAQSAAHWTDAPSLAYALFRDGQRVSGYDGSSVSYTDTGLTLGQTYIYQVATLLDGREARHTNLVALLATEPSGMAAQHSVTDDDSDREVLRDLYHSTDGDNWSTSTNWLSDRPLDEWHGVTVNEQGQVTQLVLDGNNLTGNLPADLGKLESLTRLALNRNSLTGAIPSELGSLPSLSIIGLARNQLSGALPSSMGNLTGLTRLSLHDNTGLSGPLPSGFTGLTSLQRLAIANTGLCAPSGEAFSDWLDTVDDLTPDPVPTCASP